MRSLTSERSGIFSEGLGCMGWFKKIRREVKRIAHQVEKELKRTVEHVGDFVVSAAKVVLYPAVVVVRHEQHKNNRKADEWARQAQASLSALDPDPNITYASLAKQLSVRESSLDEARVSYQRHLGEAMAAVQGDDTRP